jgi:GntR family transcriptional regulator, transcriptional repressor for pyruvate dehydrogenase complex
MSDIPFHFDSSSKGSLSDQIYACVVEEILRGDYKASGKLPTEVAMAERFGVSRPTIREALARLRSDGVIESRRGSGSHVVNRPGLPSSETDTQIRNITDIERFYAFRSCIESGAAEAAAEFHTAEGLKEIQASFDALTEALANGQLGIAEDVRFHLEISRASRNPFFVDAVATGVAPIQRYMEMARRISDQHSDELSQTVQNEHLAIVDAIARRSPEDASRAIKSHLVNAKRRIFEGIKVAS